MTTVTFTTAGSSGVISGSNLTYAATLPAWGSAVTNANPATTGKFYFEFTQTVIGANPYDSVVGLGNVSANINNYAGSDANSFGFQSNAGLLGALSGGAGESWGVGDTVMVAYDIAASKIWIGKNGTWASGDPNTETGGSTFTLTGDVTPIFSQETTASLTANFGGSSYAYTVPTGFSSVPINTFNGPIYVASAGSGYQGGSGYTITLPTTTVGNLNIVAVVNSNPASDATFVAPSGWSTIFNHWAFAVFYRIFQSGDPTSVTFVSTSGSYTAASALGYTNVDQMNPIDDSNACVFVTSTTNFPPFYRAPPVHPNYNDDVLAVFYAEEQSSGIGAPTFPTGITGRISSNSGPNICAGDKNLTDGTSTGNNDIVTWSTGANKFGCSVAIKGASTTAATPVLPEVTFGGTWYYQVGPGSGSTVLDISYFGPETNDLVAIYAVMSGGSCVPPSGYTTEYAANDCYLFTRLLQAGDPLQLTFTGLTAPYNTFIPFILRQKGGTSGEEINIGSVGSNYGGPLVAAQAISTTVANSLVMSVWSDTSSSSSGYTVLPAGLNSSDFNYSNGPSILAAWELMASTGSTGTPTAEIGSSANLNVITTDYRVSGGSPPPPVTGHRGFLCVVT